MAKTGKSAMILKKNRADSANLQKAATDRPQRTAAAPGGIYRVCGRQSLTDDLWADTVDTNRVS